jgi:uncharacterized membrane protein YphA (DoxX/SURF4 family)
MVLGSRIAVGLVFLLAGGSKLASPGSFSAALVAYDLLPIAVVHPVTLLLPWVEVLTGAWLLLGLFTRAAAWLAIALLVLFSAAIAQAMARGLSLQDCGCFGGLTQVVPVLALFLGGKDAGAADVVRDGVYAILALVVALGPAAPYSVDGLLGREPLGMDSPEPA